VRGAGGALIDGRNRFAACRMAEVDPTFTVYDGDPVAYVLSANVNRRNLSKGQRAMAVAMLNLETKSWGDVSAVAAGLSAPRVSPAATD